MKYKIPHSIIILLEDYCLNNNNNPLIGKDPKIFFNNIVSMLKKNSPYFVAEKLNISVSFVIMINEILTLKQG